MLVFPLLSPAPKQAVVRGREKLRGGSGTQHNGDNTLMTVSSHGANPQRRQDFEGKTIWKGAKTTEEKKTQKGTQTSRPSIPRCFFFK